MNVNLTIIKLGILDLKSCIELDQKSLNGLWTKSQWEKELTNEKRICIGVLDQETKKLLGLASAWKVIDELHITSLAVYPEHQRKGLGKLLMADLIKRSKSILIHHIYLEVKDNNESAKAFYESMGFKTVGNRPNFYKDGSDTLTLKKGINNK